MRKKEKWLFFVMPSLVKMRLLRLVSRDNRIIYNVLPLLMPGAKRRAFQIVLPQKKLPHKLCSSLTDAGLIPQCGWRLPGSSGCGDGLRHLLRRDGAGLCHSQNSLHAEHCGAQPGALYSRCTVQGLRMRSCKHLLAESIARFAANYAYASGLRCGTIRPPGTGRRREDEYPDLWHEQVL